LLKKSIILLFVLIMFVPAFAFADDSNLLLNGDFEGGASEETIPNEWFTEMWVKTPEHTGISVDEIDGNRVLKINNSFENDARISQNVKVKGNKTYKLSGYIFTYGVTGGQGANLSFEDVMTTTEGVFDSQGDWQYVEMYGKTSLLQRNIKVFVRVGGYGALSEGEAYFDNVKLEEVKDVPEGAAVHSLKKPKPAKEEKAGIKFLAPSLLITFIMAALYLLIKDKLFSDEINEKHIDKKTIFWAIILVGVAIRVILSVTIRGYPNDISCWLGWSSTCANVGLFNIYSQDIFIDYPPGYMYILNILGFIMKIIGTVPERMQWLIVKIPPILADIGLSIIIYKVATKKIGESKALLLMGVYFLSPAVILNSSAWGQIDGILALFVVLYLLALYNRKFWLSGIFLAVGVLMKVQMVLFAPLYLTAAWSYYKEQKGLEFVKQILYGVLAGIGTLALLGMPFFIGEGKNPLDFFGLYFGALETYDYVSINATNLWAMLGGNWTKITEPFIGAVPYSVFANIGLIASIALFLIIGFWDRKKEHIFMHAALLITGIFMLSGKMHERYMFTALALLIMSIVFTKRRSAFVLFILFSVTQFINTALVLANEHISSVRKWSDVFMGNEVLTNEKVLILIISLIAVLSYAYMIYVSFKMRNNYQEKEFLSLTSDKAASSTTSGKKKFKIESEEGFFKKLTKWDAILMAGLTAVYAIIAFINLGSTVGPENNFNSVTPNSEVVVDFGEEKDISELWFFKGKANSNASFYVSFSSDKDGEYKTENYIRITYGGMFDDGDAETAEREKISSDFDINNAEYNQIFFSNYPDILKWFTLKSEVTARYAKVTFEKPSIYMFELGFKDVEGNVIPIQEISYDALDEKMPLNLLFDEQDTIPDEITYMNGTYFDEIYHAGTAWEHINLVDPYETTHPPLGKVIMSWGIRLFGTNTFGWRFMGTLVGVLMVPVMYLLALMLLKKTRYAFIAAFLFTFDFMHFTQTRIATIDSYGVFFIMLMYLFMGIYYYMSYNKTPLKKTLIPLGLSGIAFGLGAASKWICLYAGVGLAVIFFISMFKRWKEYMYVKNDGTGISQNMADEIKRTYRNKTLITLAWCVLFFIIIPIGIYIASYIPIMKIGPSKDLAYVWRNQINMFNYHSGLDSSHPFASKFYEWPFIIKPMWYYSNDIVRGTGYMGSIAAFGNPAVWWLGTFAMIYLFVDMFLQKEIPKSAVFVLIAFLSQYLPWSGIDRSTFIYHYFASVPFIVMAIVYAIKNFEERHNMNKKVVYYYMGVVLLLFIFFYPVLSGTVIPSWYGKLMKWMPTWWFTY